MTTLGLRPVHEQSRPSIHAGSAVVGAHDGVLDEVTSPDRNVALWRRRLPLELAAALRRAPVPDGCVERVLRAGAALQLEPFAALVPPAARRWLVADLEGLAAAFQRVTGAAAFAASLAVVRSDSCRKFHVDCMRMRLLCTYLGPGTEWVDDAHANRAAFALATDDVDLVNSVAVPDPAHVQRAAPGDVILLKGQTWPGHAGRGAIHRSPPIEARGITRMVFKLSLR